jgi:K+-sensing histidine kinase KdpD
VPAHPPATAKHPADSLPVVSAGLSGRRQRWATALLLMGLPALTAVLVSTRDRLSFATPVLLVLTLVVAVAFLGGLRVALPGALLGGLALNWFFTPPFNTLVVDQPEQLLVLGVYSGFAVAVSVIVDVAARRTAEATRARAEARALSTLAGATLAEAKTLPDLLERVRATFHLRQVSLLEPGAEGFSAAATVSRGAAEPGEVELRVPAGGGVVLSAWGPELFAEDQRVLASFAEAAGTALQGRRLAEQAQASARLEAADRMRTALLAAVGHDLRTPLSGIKAAVSSLRQTDVQFTGPERAELLETIEVSADRLQALVANLLDASRLQAGALSVRLEPTWLDEVAGRVLLALPEGDRGHVALDLPEDVAAAQADPGLLERVLANLVDNALRHTPVGCLVTVRARALDTKVVGEVVDHGPGVPADQHEQVFAPFQRLGDRNPGGAGLGLAVARGFTEAMGGTLVPCETAGGGLTMRVTLPRAPSPRPLTSVPP